MFQERLASQPPIETKVSLLRNARDKFWIMLKISQNVS